MKVVFEAGSCVPWWNWSRTCCSFQLQEVSFQWEPNSVSEYLPCSYWGRDCFCKMLVKTCFHPRGRLSCYSVMITSKQSCCLRPRIHLVWCSDWRTSLSLCSRPLPCRDQLQPQKNGVCWWWGAVFVSCAVMSPGRTSWWGFPAGSCGCHCFSSLSLSVPLFRRGIPPFIPFVLCNNLISSCFLFFSLLSPLLGRPLKLC